MSIVKRNIIANFACQGWAALMNVALVPLYIKLLGIEAYGLIGFYAMLQSAFTVLDLGLCQTMNREMARYSALPNKAGEARDLVRTLETGYWTIGIVIGVGVVIAAPYIGEHWIRTGSIPVKTVQHAIMIMGIVIALRWPLGFYEGIFMGLQRQVLFNTIKIGVLTLSGGGAILILWKYSSTITAFFMWQIMVSILYVGLLIIILWHILPSVGRPAAFNLKVLSNIWKFAAGMSGIALSGVLLTQIDKIILSKLLSLEMYGFYTLAAVASSVVPAMLVGPIYYSLLPRLASLVVANDDAAIKLLYHQGSQLMAVTVFPISAVLAFFSYDILFLWSGNAKAASMAAPIVSVLLPGMALNALISLPYGLHMSYGLTSIWLRINMLSLIALVPAIYFLTMLYGAVGAASVWLALNFIYVLFAVPFTHKHLLKGEMSRWYREDVIPPFVAALVITALWHWLVSVPQQPVNAIFCLSAILLTSFIAAILAAPTMRTWLFTHLLRDRTVS